MILEALREKVDLNNDGPIANQIHVVRSNIMENTLRAMTRRSFDPSRRLSVVFVDSFGTGEGAVDDGGPTREFVRLLMNSVLNSKFFAGSMEERSLALDSQGNFENPVMKPSNNFDECDGHRVCLEGLLLLGCFPLQGVGGRRTIN